MLKTSDNPTIYLKDYQPPDFRLLSCELDFELDSVQTRVTARYEIEALSESRLLELDGEALELVFVHINGEPVTENTYRIDKRSLTISEVPEKFLLSIQTLTRPEQNTSLNGLYQSGDMLCTQCEAQGFRRIAYSLDRPDVLTTYTVKLLADKVSYPVLLSNGNLIEQGEQGENHYAVWQDPFPKPTYLFALVAGNLVRHSDNFTTCSGKTVDIHVLTRPEDAGKTAHAMASLQRSMRWDEQAYDREYDLDVYHIVAVGDFNMGAMENKSLNVFNTKYVLARPEMATDQDYHAIEGVIGHEYFHNWSGNRVTCRDWFQLSLKEGFTVFRDQQFSGDMGSSGVQRISDVNVLRNVQFKEDAGPMAHPVRPDSYEEINNFYTVTVYEKGAEVVRMLHTLLGESGFKHACNLYFETFDGQAVTTDDFISSMEKASGLELSQFRLWYSQAGTPRVSLETSYDKDAKTLTLNFRQHTPDTPGQSDKAAFLIPVKIALFDNTGERLTFSFEGQGCDEPVLHLNQHQQTFELDEVNTTPITSALRGFSAPVKLDYAQDVQSLIFLAKHDDDAFNRWEAMQRLSMNQIRGMMAGKEGFPDNKYLSLYDHILADTQTDPMLLSQLLSLPGESYISQDMDTIDPDLVHQTRELLIAEIANTHRHLLHERYMLEHTKSSGRWTPAETEHRALRDACLSILIRVENEGAYTHATRQYEQARCMTDTMSALGALNHSQYANKQAYLDDFHRQWQAEDLLVNKWFGLQSQQVGKQALNNIVHLTKHPDFDLKNPNKVYSLIGSFLHGNAVTFHAKDGSGYAFATRWILKLNATNPQVAARLVGCFNQWKRYDVSRQSLMKAQMQAIARHPELSDNVSEIINKALGQEAPIK
ncbi:MAG: aminopeptidase N [Proteobacteria bacterium]|nr:aminopeptidase N [Pseudomonadota bacterium]